MTVTRLALAGALLAVVLLGTLGQSRLYYDYAWQLMSVRDYAEGTAANPFLMRSADPADLTRDRQEWTIGYPLAYNATATLLTMTGLTPAHAHRAIAIAFVCLGVLGWHFFLQGCTPLSPRARAGLLLAVALSYNGALMVTFMMPEVFLFASVPWQLWALWHATDRATAPGPRLRYCGWLGLVTGVAYTFRYLAALHGLALLGFTALWLWRERPARWLPSGLMLASCAALPVIALSVLNYTQTGSIHSVSSGQPWGFAPRWPDANQWLLMLVGPVQALFGASILFSRLANFIRDHGLAVPSHAAYVALSFSLAIPTALFSALLLIRFAPRDRLLAAGLLGLGATVGGLLWLYSRSTIPQTDPRYFVGAALLLVPSLALAGRELWRQSPAWRFAALVLLAPTLLALPAAGYSAGRSLLAREPESRDGLIAGGQLDPTTLQAAVRARLPDPEAEIVWMCFQPGVLQALPGRHVCETYLDRAVTYRASRPVNLVVLRDRPPAMHPSVYRNNQGTLALDRGAPDLEHGGYEVFIRLIGPAGPVASAQPPRP